MEWGKTRLTVYLVSVLAMSATLLSLAGLADYDAATGLLDIRPFNINMVAGVGAGLVASALALLANVLGWKTRPKKDARPR